MLINTQGKKDLLNFLLQRWSMLSPVAGVERVYVASAIFAHQNNVPIPPQPDIIGCQPVKQIDMMKRLIIDMIPEAKFIDYHYEAPAPLSPDDFLELYVEENRQCITKVRNLMEQLKIS